MQGAEGVPQGEDGVVRLSLLRPADVVIHPQIAAVHVRKDGGGNQGMIQSRVEHPAPDGIGRADLNARKLAVPRCGSCPAHPVEVPSGNLLLHVGAGSLHVHGRQARLHHHLFALGQRGKAQQGFHAGPGGDSG